MGALTTIPRARGTNRHKTTNSRASRSPIGLLKDVQRILADAINSLGNKPYTTPESAYLMWAAVCVNRAAEGYLCLRETCRVTASKFLVRPALEATFSGTAVTKKPGFLFRKAYSELEEVKKIFAKDDAGAKAANHALENLKRAFQQKHPGLPN